MRKIALILLPLFVTPAAFAAIHTETVPYKHGTAVLEGYLAYDDAVLGKRPGVLVVHEWWGLNDYPKKRAEQLAALGYAAFALDIYGKGVVTKDPAEAGRLSGLYKGDRPLMRGRANAGLKILQAQPNVDTGRIAAIGYCFGGTVALELARAGAKLAGVVAFHAGLDTPDPRDAGNIRGKVLVLTGGDDAYVPAPQREAFIDEMRKAGVDWQMNLYGGAIHAFTNPAAGSDKSKGIGYNEAADRRSWQAMTVFFDEIFNPKKGR